VAGSVGRGAADGSGSADRLVAELIAVVGRQHVLVDPDLVAGYCTDWTGRFVGRTPAVVRPGSTDEVAGVMSACRRHGAALSLQGGNTGLAGGAVPLRGEVVCSLRRLTTLSAVDGVSGQLTAGAGVPIAAVQAAAAAAGWSYGVDFASRDSATVGGSVATNAGGLRVLRYGDTRAQLLGVEAVLGTGDVVSHLGGLTKDNTGYHLPSLLCGSEGTLGVVTAVRLRLVSQERERVVALLAFDDVVSAVVAVGSLRAGLAALSAAELFFDEGLALVCRVTGLAAPFASHHRVYVLVEAAGSLDPSPALAAAVDALRGVADAAVATDAGRAGQLWRYREAHTEAIATVGTPHKLDVTVPAGSMVDFVATVPAIVQAVCPGAQTWLFGHAGDGNLHVNVTGAAPADDRIDEAVLSLAARMGGSISAEHGIGAAKARWLSLNRSPAEISAFRAIKGALDPDGLLNPSVLFPPAAESSPPGPVR
jgi:FAD/FMN-containing dehydrogenase